jgi:hypothetical protein
VLSSSFVRRLPQSKHKKGAIMCSTSGGIRLIKALGEAICGKCGAPIVRKRPLACAFLLNLSDVNDMRLLHWIANDTIIQQRCLFLGK